MTLEELEEILLSIALKDDDPTNAENSFLKLYRHYSVSVQSITIDALNKMGIYDTELMNTALNNTFVKIFENPPLDFKIKDDNTLDNCFIAYLVTITKNDIFSLLKPKNYNKMMWYYFFIIHIIIRLLTHRCVVFPFLSFLSFSSCP